VPKIPAVMPGAAALPGPAAIPVAQAASGGAGAATGAAGGLGGLAGVAGAIAAPIAAVGIASAAVGKAADFAARAMQTFAAATAKVARNEFFEVITAAPRKITAALESVPLIGGSLSLLPKVTLAAVDAVKVMTDAFLVRAKEIEDFSPDIAVASAQADVRQMFADIREADKLGPDLARLIEAESNVSVMIQDALLPIKKVVVEVLANLLEDLPPYIEGAKAFFITIIESVKTLIEVTVDIASFRIPAALQALLELPERTAKAIKDSEEPEPKPEVIEKWMRELFNMMPAGRDPSLVDPDIMAQKLAQFPQRPVWDLMWPGT
jgi:hypothetical protein